MHLLPRTDNRVDGAGWKALGAANTDAFVDLGDQRRTLNAIRRVERQRLAMK